MLQGGGNSHSCDFFLLSLPECLGPSSLSQWTHFFLWGSVAQMYKNPDLGSCKLHALRIGLCSLRIQITMYPADHGVRCHAKTWLLYWTVQVGVRGLLHVCVFRILHLPGAPPSVSFLAPWPHFLTRLPFSLWKPSLILFMRRWLWVFTHALPSGCTLWDRSPLPIYLHAELGPLSLNSLWCFIPHSSKTPLPCLTEVQGLTQGC